MAKFVGVIGAYPHTDALLSGPLSVSGGHQVELRPFATVAGGAGALFARQAGEIAGFDFDISELPIVNYLSSKEHGAEHIALPVFVTRRFVQNLLIVDREMVRHPKDLEGHRVGLLYHGHSDSTWLRGILAERYDVDLSRVTWVTETEEQVPGAVLPPNVVHIPRTSIAEMLISGEVVGQITSAAPLSAVPAGRDIGPLWPDTEAIDEAWYRDTGILPLLHTVVIKHRALKVAPDLVTELYSAFVEARDRAVAAVDGGAALPAGDRRRAESSGFPTVPVTDSPRPYLGPDPIPYGLGANRHSLETLVRMARRAGVIGWDPPVDDLFAPVD